MNPSDHDPLDYFQQLWPNSLVDVLVTETNRYARGKGVSNWVDVDRVEMWTFLGIILSMGIHKLPRVRNYWSNNKLLGVEEVQRHMTMARFWKIWSNLHVVDNSTLLPSDGLTAKIKPVLDILGNTFFSSYSPGQEMCVDEAMIKYKGRVKKGKVKMPRKPIKDGFKVWCCCCSCCGYLSTFQVYEGRPVNPRTGKKVSERGLTKRVVLDLLNPFEGLNHVVYLDNFFSSVPLVDALAELDIFTAGTIKQRASGFPEVLKGLQPSVGEYASVTVDGTVYSTFHDRKVVSFVSNVFPESMEGRLGYHPIAGF